MNIKSKETLSHAKNKKLTRVYAAVILLAVLAVLLSAAGIVALNMWADAIRQSQLNFYSEGMKNEMDTVLSHDFGSIEELTDELAEKHTSVSYWFIYTEDGIVMEKDKTFTEKYMGYSISDLMENYTRNGGKEISNFSSMLNSGDDFSAVITKNINTGSEYLTVKFAEIDGIKYAVGYSALCSYIYSLSNINSFILQMGIIVGIFIGMFLITVTVSAYLTLKNNRRLKNLEGDVKLKNLKIEDLYELTESADSSSRKDAETGLYNKALFDTTIDVLCKKERKDIAVILIKQPYVDLMMYSDTAHYRNIIAATAEMLINTANKNDIVSRIGTDFFSIITTKVYYDDTLSRLIQKSDESSEASYVIIGSDRGENAREVFIDAVNKLNYTDKIKKGVHI